MGGTRKREREMERGGGIEKRQEKEEKQSSSMYIYRHIGRSSFHRANSAHTFNEQVTLLRLRVATSLINGFRCNERVHTVGGILPGEFAAA